jgi:maleate cis-trans isomerase
MADSATIATVGVIKPVNESLSHPQLVSIMPEGVAFESVHLGVKYRSVAEFREVMALYEQRVPEMVSRGVDLLHPEGAPPFMLEGLDGERDRIKAWEDRFQIPVFTTGMTQLAAMEALGVRRFVGVTPFSGELANVFRRYFEQAGLDVQAMTTPVPPPDSIYDHPAEEILGLVTAAFRAHGDGAEALYLLGSDWPVFEIAGEIEAEIGVPVLHPVPVRCWYIQKKLGLNEPVQGYGRLLAEMI